MTAFDDLKAAVDRLETTVTAENTEMGTLVSELNTANTELATLQAQIAAGTPVTEQQIADVTARVTAIADSAAAALAAAAPPPAPPA